MVARYEPLLLQQPQELPARLQLLSAALQLPPSTAAELLATAAPQLLATPLRKLQSNLGQLARVLSSRGLKPAEILQDRPDLLCQSPASVALKLEELPGALGMSRQLVRQLISRCPQLLRRSVSTIQHRCAAVRHSTLCKTCVVLRLSVQQYVFVCQYIAVQMHCCAVCRLSKTLLCSLSSSIMTDCVRACPAGIGPCASCSRFQTHLCKSSSYKNQSCCACQQEH